jgi:dTDP-glucose pyrophosphorylase
MKKSDQKWMQVLLSPTSSISDSIEKLSIEGLRIALVVDVETKLLGTITDGDVRRALINNPDLTLPVESIMNTNPISLLSGTNDSLIQETLLKNDILQIPILDEMNHVVGLEILQDTILREKKINNPVLLMAGGFGKRLRPLTKEVPKPLLKVSSKPILETILLQFIELGFHDFFISVHYKKDDIENYFGDGSKWNVCITYLYEEEPLGTAGALGLLPKEKITLPLIMMNGDLITRLNFEKLISFHKEQGGIATVCARNYDYQLPYGLIETENDNIKNIIEKPVYNYLVNAGVYVLEPMLLQNIEKNKPLTMPELIRKILTIKEKVNVYPIHEYWIDIGRTEELERAMTEFNISK